MIYRWLLLVPVLLGAPSVRADDIAPLTLRRVVELAKSRAPAVSIARARVEEAGAGLVGARRFATRNPVLAVDAGPRWEGDRSTDVQGSVSFPLDLGGRRDKRVAVAEATIGREQLDAENTQRDAIARAVVGYYQLLYAERGLALAEERVRLAQAAEDTARQRTKAGDAPAFEVNLASGEVARAEGTVAAARAALARARGGLAVALGVPMSEIVVAGELADRATLDGAPDAKTIRADLGVVAQEAKLAGAEANLARGERSPSLDLRITYQHERDAEIVLGGLAVSLPMFDRGQGDEAKARARAKRAQAELVVRSTAISTQLESARATYDAALAAVRVYEDRAVPRSIENESAAAASYRAGKLELGSFLLIRREALETRREHLDRLLEAALAAVDLWIARGATL